MTRAHHCLFLFAAISLFVGVASAQGPTLGTPPFGSFSGSPDTVNNANLNVHYTIPIRHTPGRGTNFSYDVTYDSSIWYPVGASGNQTWQPVTNFGWGGIYLIASGYITYSTIVAGPIPCNPPNNMTPTYYSNFGNWVFVDSNGSAHSFSGGTNRSGNSNCPTVPNTPQSFTSVASDGSGYKLVVNSWTSATIYTTNGTALILPENPPLGPTASMKTDRNGNQISSNTSGVFTDTLGQTALTVAGTAPSNTTLTYTAPSGASAAYKTIYTSYTIQTAFGCSNIHEYGPVSANLVSEIDLPDISVNANDKYTFAYETTPNDTHNPHYVTGRLKSVTLPTGGTITYAYSGGSSGNITCADGSAATLARTLSDGAGWSGTWTYARTLVSGTNWQTIITDPERDSLAPNGNDTVLQFQGIYETQRQVYQGLHTGGTLLGTLATCYNGAASPCNGTAITLPIARRSIVTLMPNGKQSEHDDFWNTYGAPTETDDYDYGAAPHGPLLKKVLATYATTLGNITAFSQTVITCNGTGTSPTCNNTGTPVSQVTYGYDETAVSTPVNLPTPQHVSVSTPRGNLTSTNVYTSSTAYLRNSSTYYDTGMVKTATDVNGGSMTYTYGALTATCGNAFPTSVTEAISTLTQSRTWNCAGGVQLTATDENGKVTTTSYLDPYFWRPASVTDPANAVTNYCYGVLTGGTCTPNQNQSESTLNFNSGNSTVDTLTTLDGLGRSRLQQTRQGPGLPNFDSVETDYDAVGRASRVTVPYSGTAGQTNSTVAGTTTTYDAMSRPLTIQDGGGGTTTYNYGTANDVLVTRGPHPTNEGTKVRQFEHDALGRLSSVCEVTAGATPWLGGSCAQVVPQTGYWTKYTYDPLGNMMSLTQNAQMSGSTQSRSFVYDWTGRMTSETVPEIGASGNGTAYYTYDSDSTCGSAPGDLVKRLDAAGNTICSTYDLLHRELTRTFPSGPYASVTPQKHFVYDGATVSGQTMQNAQRHLAEAYTGSSTAKITDIGFSYSNRGETTDVYESTPHSGTTGATYNHSSAQFWASGAINQISGPGFPTITYTPDSKGRSNTVSASSGQNPVTGTTYNSASLPTAINLGSGSGDADTFTWDASTNRMTQYKFTVNSASLTGVLGWNANGTLQTQNITDGFNSTDTQNCTYLYDDITRLTSANCGSAAAQTFTFDPFGNIQKSGSPYQFLPTYSPPTNRMTLLAGFTPTYDNNGNLTNDALHNYAWDAEGHPITVDAGLSDAVSVTYDALGRMVEQARGTNYNQIVYGPGGSKLALMTGTSLQKAMVPLSGKATAVYNSSGLLYYAHPDMLGSIRLATTPTTRAMYFDTAYAPFGETYVSAGGSSLEPTYTGEMDDTAHRQDTVGGLYDFPLREYSTQGRWASPDPAGRSATCPKDPQTQNRYAYVRNNPITFVDPIGAFGTPPCSEYDPLCQMCAANPDAPMCQNSCDPLEPFCGDPAFGGGGFLPAGSNNPEKPPQFPWLLLPIGFFQGQDTGTQTLSLVRARCDENPKERNGPEYNLGCLWKGATRVSDSPCVLPISQSGPGGCIDRETARVNLRDGSYTTLVCAQKITIDMNCDPETARKPWFIEGTVKIK